MKIGIIFGAFDLLHAGHVHLLCQCKMRCDKLVVGLHVDPSIERSNKNKPLETVLERQMKLRSNKNVDDIFVYETEEDLRLLLMTKKFHVRFLGTDYAQVNHNNPPKITEENLIPIEYIDSLPIHTSDLRERILKA